MERWDAVQKRSPSKGAYLEHIFVLRAAVETKDVALFNAVALRLTSADYAVYFRSSEHKLLNNWAILLKHLNAFEQSRRAYECAKKRALENNDTEQLVKIALNLHSILLKQGKLDDAKHVLQEVETLSKETFYSSRLSHKLGMYYQAEKDYDRASEFYQQAFVRFSLAHDFERAAISGLNLLHVQLVQRNRAGFWRYAQSVKEIIQQVPRNNTQYLLHFSVMQKIVEIMASEFSKDRLNLPEHWQEMMFKYGLNEEVELYRAMIGLTSGNAQLTSNIKREVRNEVLPTPSWYLNYCQQ
ncbi:hypothetical protein NI389_04140 [Pseudoalteromonas xiamenensis]|uniref:hypothetical protein n=1 Tax=Pseudoalteromonas xiamenensis TaxID=882626 RepID=UPI0027E48511|nr:hypothetical protein [Pseudoalteromonas xiamenensis]WMN60603.1 hypothetical protein NI389_04140 [Pseudoalteromonas xiamenensis]